MVLMTLANHTGPSEHTYAQDDLPSLGVSVLKWKPQIGWACERLPWRGSLCTLSNWEAGLRSRCTRRRVKAFLGINDVTVPCRMEEVCLQLCSALAWAEEQLRKKIQLQGQ